MCLQNELYFCKRLDCPKTTDYCKTASCTLKLVNRTTQFGFFGCDLRKPVTKAHFRFSLYLRSNTIYKPFLIDFVEDGCSFLTRYFQNKTISNPLIKALLDPFMRHSNVKHSCPIMQNVLIHNWNINNFMFKDLIPSGEYLIKNHIYDPDGNVTIYKVNTYFVVPASGLLGFSIGK